jgi:tRNA threonylcarbamoyl adenosine modification protein YeaZ/ribosomal-protein-alanine acetyltransferase
MAGVADANDAGEEDEGVVTGGEDAGKTRTTSEYNIAAMVILALETVTRAGSLALLDDDACLARAGDAHKTHGERLPGEILAFLGEHRRTLHDVDLLAVVVGPGSFTGLRVGLAAVQGLALAGHKRVVAVPTLEAMADAWVSQRPRQGRTRVVPCLDGQRGEVFFAAWDAEPDEVAVERGPVIAPGVGPPADLLRELDAHPTTARQILVGSGARRYAAAFLGEGHALDIDDTPVPLAEVAARAAARRPETAVAPHALRPFYIRRPDAVLARERARGMEARAPGLRRGGAAARQGFAITRAAAGDDLSAVEALQRRAFTNAWGAEAIRWELANTDVARLYVMQGPEDSVVAYCACWLLFDELHLNSLAVDEAWRRRGLASRLLARVFRDSVAAGARSATLEVRQSNTAARALYEGLGFRVEAVRRSYYQEPREDALILWHRHLADAAPDDA